MSNTYFALYEDPNNLQPEIAVSVQLLSSTITIRRYLVVVPASSFKFSSISNVHAEYLD